MLWTSQMKLLKLPTHCCIHGAASRFFPFFYVFPPDPNLLHAMKFSKVPKFFSEKKCKKETKSRGLQGPVGLLHLTLRFFCSSLNGKDVASD
jgi:hypothetical protein